MALVVVTYGGNVSVTQSLDDHACTEAKSVALYGKSIEAKAADDAAAAKAALKWQAEQDAAQAAWEKANPKIAARCKAHEPPDSPLPACGPMSWTTTTYMGPIGYLTGDTIKYAECVK